MIIVSSICLFGSIACLTPGAVGWLRRWLRREEQRFHEVLSELFMLDVSPRMLSYLSLGAIVLFGLFGYGLSSGSGAMALVGAFIGYIFPRIITGYMRRKRLKRLNAQLIDGLVTLANGLRAGLNLAQSIKLVADHTRRPICDEFRLMLTEFDYGMSMDEVLNRASARIKLHNYELLFLSLQTARRRGGNLADTLDRFGESLREILRLEGKIRAVTAEGRSSAIGMGLMPIVVLGVYYMIDPEGVGLLFSGYGWYILLVAAILNVTGALWIRKIVRFEI
ncbi:MAG: type II secretion system F family protein [Planctomycetia bacterium]|nr:type II secretion system F family protein [Planctomycetia bacterium]